jgi:mannosyltransferase OCH1-like enzyme
MNKLLLVISIIVILFIFVLFFQLFRENREYFDNLFHKYQDKEICKTKPIIIDNKIPPFIFQSWNTKDLKSNLKNCVEWNKKQNPNITFYLYDDKDCEFFLQNHFNERVLKAYRKLIPGAYKADLWRYCILYKYGGIYMDIKFKFFDNVDVHKIFVQPTKEIFVRDFENMGNGIYNAFMVCQPGNLKLLYCINKIIENTEKNYYGDSSLHPTGPMLLKEAFNEDELKKLEYQIEMVDNMGIVIKNKYTKQSIASFCKDYRKEQKEQNTVPYYGDLWNNRTIYS